jgi:ABC-type transport system involved in multi-copper enzyme maturation permease subunit
MSLVLKEEELLFQKSDHDRQKAGLRRDFIQLGDTITFELKKNLKKLYTMLLVYLGIFFLSFLLNEFLWDLMGDIAPADSASLMKNYIGGWFSMALLISTATFGGSIIAEDFYRQTGNLLFPKISKTRLLMGRLIANYMLNAVCIVFFYLLVSITTFIKYGEVANTIFYSIGWALLYTLVLLSFITFLSSFMKNTSFTIITSILIVLIVMEMIPFILNYSGVTENNEIPMYFLFNYFGYIISESLAMPTQRYITEMGGPPGSQMEYSYWVTPSEIGAAIGMIMYIIIFLSLSYIFYQRRQSKGE